MSSLEQCIRLRLEEPELVVRNECDEPIVLEEVEVKYYTTGLSYMPRRVVETKRVRRLITERIRLGLTVERGGEASIYFGSTDTIVEVYAEVRTASGTLKVKLL
jgi:hypothetical protein